MYGESIMEFANEIDIDPMSIDLLVLFWKLGCKKRYCITEEEFIYGMAKLDLETKAKMKSKIPKLKDELNDPEVFKDFYVFCFNYMKEPVRTFFIEKKKLTNFRNARE